MKRRTVTALIAVLMVVGLCQCGHGAWIYVKAELAQQLLQHAWAKTMDGQEHVKPWPWADTWPVARLRVPRHNVDLFVLAGASGRTLAFGPAVVNDGSDQGFRGTIIISGHRDTHFQFLQNIRHGDEVIIERPGQPHRTYRVTGIQIMNSQTTKLISDPDGDQLLLVTCYPFDAMIPGGPLRYVVTAGLTAGGGFFSSAPFNRPDGEIQRGERLAVYRTQFQNEQGRELVKLWMLFEKLLKLL